MREHRLRRTVRVRLSSRIASPVTCGVLCPVILLPASMDAGGAFADGYGGRIVHVFEDTWPIGPGMEAGTVMQFPDGEVDVYGVRDLSTPIVRNADGSFDPSGTLLGLREATKEEFDARTREMGR